VLAASRVATSQALALWAQRSRLEMKARWPLVDWPWCQYRRREDWAINARALL